MPDGSEFIYLLCNRPHRLGCILIFKNLVIQSYACYSGVTRNLVKNRWILNQDHAGPWDKKQSISRSGSKPETGTLRQEPRRGPACFFPSNFIIIKMCAQWWITACPHICPPDETPQICTNSGLTDSYYPDWPSPIVLFQVFGASEKPSN